MASAGTDWAQDGAGARGAYHDSWPEEALLQHLGGHCPFPQFIGIWQWRVGTAKYPGWTGCTCLDLPFRHVWLSISSVGGSWGKASGQMETAHNNRDETVRFGTSKQTSGLEPPMHEFASQKTLANTGAVIDFL